MIMWHSHGFLSGEVNHFAERHITKSFCLKICVVVVSHLSFREFCACDILKIDNMHFSEFHGDLLTKNPFEIKYEKLH